MSHQPWLAAIAISASLLSGCTVGPQFVRPGDRLQNIVLAPRDDYAGVAAPSSNAFPTQWWTLFNDPLLTDLQSRGLVSNPELQIAAARIEQSRALLGIAASTLLPSVQSGGNFARSAISEHGRFAALGAPGTPSDFWQIGFDASWEIDLWGRARRLREGAQATLEATGYEREAIRVAVSAEVARSYLLLRGTQAQLEIAEQNAAIARRALGLAQSRERNGTATRFEAASARAQLATVEALVPELTQHRNTQMNALALLLDEPPRALDARLREALPVPAFPANVPVGLPSDVARRRPDILRAEARLHAATAAIGVAKADFYPRVSLSGRVGVEAFDIGNLDSWDSRYFSIGPTVYLPIFQGGRLKQRLALSEAQQTSAALAYRRTVLRAWHEVDNALDAWASQKRQHAQLQISVAQDKEALRVAERGYQQGAADYLAVLTAQRSLLASQTRLNTSTTGGALTLVNLYKSLGGGWDPDSIVQLSPPGPQAAADGAAATAAAASTKTAMPAAPRP